MHDEYELKLALSPEQLDALSRNQFVRSLIQDRKASTRLVSTYFDSPARLLQQRAMALRVRQAGRSRIQTLKVKANGSSGLQHFQEYEAQVPGDRPELDRIDDPGLKALFEENGLAAEIAPVFTTDFARRKYVLRLFESEIELALDKGEIQSGGQSLPICEAELELLSGRPARLYELALALRDSVPFRLEFRTKAGRGYALASNAAARPVTGAKPALSPEMTAGQAFQAIARACRDQIQGNEPAVLNGLAPGGDPEGVHQMRVGIRRLRAALRAFRRILEPKAVAYLKGELRWMQRELGPARDWDVFLTETLPPVRAALPEESGFDALASTAQAARRRAYERATGVITDARFVRFLLQLNLWLEEDLLLVPPAGRWDGSGPGGARPDPAAEPIRAFAGRVLQRCDKKLRRTGRRLDRLGTEELHQLRIEAKKTRYAIEFFRALYEERAVKKTLKALVAIQDSLGAMNDLATCQSLLKDLRVSAALGDDFNKPLTERAVGLISGWQAAMLGHRTDDFGAVWAGYKKTKPFWS